MTFDRLIAWLGSCVCALLVTSSLGCGDDGAVNPCGSDVDCKGDRICEEGTCVDPGGGSGGDGDGDGAGDGDGSANGDGDGDGDGDGGGGTGGSTGSGVIDDPALEAACTLDCEAKDEVQCESVVGSVDQCAGQCLIIDEINGGYCNDERREQYECLAEGGYECVMGYPRNKATCFSAQTALAECSTEIPCHQFCDAAEGSCVPWSGDCFEGCEAERLGFEDVSCSYDYTRLLSCWGQSLVCDGGRPTLEGCESAATDVADCISRRGVECDGYCWLAEQLGCGTGCMSSCTTQSEDPNCGSRYNNLIDCAVGFSEFSLSCDQGVPFIGDACDSSAQDYSDCLAGL